jgi:HlyD family secretion protein
MSGTVSALNKEVGEIALGSQFQADVILVIADLSEMEAQVNVDENDIVSIRNGQAAEVEADALLGQTLKGSVHEISSSANALTAGTSEQKTEFEIKIAITDPGSQLRPGMTASADIVTDVRPAALGVPIQSVAVRTPEQLAPAGKEGEKKEAPAEGAAAASAYVPDKEGFVEVVFVVVDGVAHARQVKTGIQSETHIELLEGVAAGDQVVTGSYRAISRDLKDGTAVTVGTGGGESAGGGAAGGRRG